jgi:hypothetical protein
VSGKEPFRHFREKKTEVIKVYCTPGDKRMFEEFFGCSQLSGVARMLLHRELRRGKNSIFKGA